MYGHGYALTFGNSWHTCAMHVRWFVSLPLAFVCLFVCLFLPNHDATFILDDLVWNRLICFWAMWCLSIAGGGGHSRREDYLWPLTSEARQISPPLHSLYHTSILPSSISAFAWSIFQLLLSAVALSYFALPLHPISPNIHTCTYMFQSAPCTYVYFP